MSHELDAIAAAVIGTLILGVMTSGFTFPGVGAYIQDTVKGLIIVAAVTADRYRRGTRRNA